MGTSVWGSAQVPPAWQEAALRRALLPLNSLRTVSTTSVMVFHHLRLRRHFGGDALNEAFRQNPGAIHPILQGFIGLEVLFVLCGFLAAITLVPLLEDRRRPVKQAVLLYYWRRAARIAPAHWVSLLLAYFTMLRGRDQIPVPEAAGALMHYPPESCPGGLWVQAAFLGHWQFGGGCSLQLWSQGTQAAFWAAAPLLMAALGPRRPACRSRVAWTAGIVVVLSTAYRAWVVWRYNIPLPFAAFGSHLQHENRDFQRYQYYFHYPLLCRAAGLSIGCLAALPLLDPRSWQPGATRQQLPADSQRKGAALQHRDSGGRGGVRGLHNGTNDDDAVASGGRGAAESTPPQLAMPPMVMVLGTCLTIVVIHVMATTHVFKPAGDPSWPRAQSLAYLVLMVQGGTISSTAIAFFIAAAVAGAGPAGRVLRLLLGGGSWKLLANLSYSAYLYHEHARFWVWRYGILPSGLAKSADDLGAFAVDMAVSLPATFAVAAVSYHLVERPAAAAARRLEPVLFGGGSRRHVDGASAADVCKTEAA